MADLDLHVGLDGILGDMSDHQRRTSQEVTAEANRTLAADLIQRMDREESEAKPAPAPKPKLKLPDPVEPNHVRPALIGGTEKREGKHGQYIVNKSLVDDTKFRKANEAEHWFLSHAMPRAAMLLEKRETGPLGQVSWRDRTLAVMELHTRVGALRMANRHVEASMLERRFMHELLELLEASSAAFGDLKRDVPARISVSG